MEGVSTVLLLKLYCAHTTRSTKIDDLSKSTEPEHIQRLLKENVQY